MAINRRIPADHGLTVRMFITGLLMVLLYALVIGILFAVGLNLGVILVLAAAFLFCQYWFSDKIALFGMHGRIVTPEQEPELHGIVDRLCALADMKKPRVAVADVDMPNAFATGSQPFERGGVRHPGHHAPPRRARARSRPGPRAVARGPPRRGHHDHRQLPRDGGRPHHAVHDLRRDLRRFRRQGATTAMAAGQAAMVELAVIVVSAVIYAISFLLTMALSRYSRAGRRPLRGDPDRPPVAPRLGPCQGDRGDVAHPHPGPALGRAFQRLLLHPRPVQGTSLSTLFSTHPPLQKRLDQLAKLEAEMNQPG